VRISPYFLWSRRLRRCEQPSSPPLGLSLFPAFAAFQEPLVLFSVDILILSREGADVFRKRLLRQSFFFDAFPSRASLNIKQETSGAPPALPLIGFFFSFFRDAPPLCRVAPPLDNGGTLVRHEAIFIRYSYVKLDSGRRSSLCGAPPIFFSRSP